MRASAFLLAAQRAVGVGEPTRPGFPPGGGSGKGASGFLAARRQHPARTDAWNPPGSLRILFIL